MRKRPDVGAIRSFSSFPQPSIGENRAAEAGAARSSVGSTAVVSCSDL